MGYEILCTQLLSQCAYCVANQYCWLGITELLGVENEFRPARPTVLQITLTEILKYRTTSILAKSGL